MLLLLLLLPRFVPWDWEVKGQCEQACHEERQNTHVNMHTPSWIDIAVLWLAWQRLHQVAQRQLLWMSTS